MILFQIKKTFFDMWDNMLAVFILNFGFILILAGGIYLPSLFSFSAIAATIGVCVAIIVFYQYVGIASLFAREISDYTSLSFRGIVDKFKEVWKQSLVLSIITIIQFLVIQIAFPFYLNMGGFIGVAALSIIFWMSFAWLIASQFYYPIRTRLDSSVKKIIKKSFMVFFDNTLFSLALALGTLVVVLLSGFTAFLLPGLTTVLIWHQVGFKLRLLKYDYLEENPDADRKKIPWDALLIDDKDRVGHRTLKGMIFPWKE